MNAKPISVLAFDVRNLGLGPHTFVEPKRISVSLQICADLRSGGKHGSFLGVGQVRKDRRGFGCVGGHSWPNAAVAGRRVPLSPNVFTCLEHEWHQTFVEQRFGCGKTTGASAYDHY